MTYRICTRRLLTPTLAFVFVSLIFAAAAVRLAAGGQEAGEAPTSPATRDALMADGQAIYGRDCLDCHMEGGMGPALSGRAALGNTDRVLQALIGGVQGTAMPPFGPTLSDHQIAAVATYIRNAMDNAHGVVLEADVTQFREQLGGRHTGQ